MREYLFHGKRTDNGEWVDGYYVYDDSGQITEQPAAYIYRLNRHPCGWDLIPYEVVPESVGQYTGMNEFMLIDENRNAPLFEGDIVEVWGWRSVYGRTQSQYDQRVKVRGIIYFGGRGQWRIDYDNKYNEALAKLKGLEMVRRKADGASELYYYGYHGSDIDGYRAKKLEWHGRFHNQEDVSGHYDIQKIGNMFENADLLEG